MKRRFPIKKRGFWQWFNESPLAPAILILVLGLLVGPVWRLYQKNRLVSNEQRVLLEEVRRLEERRDSLATEVEKLSTERGLEAAIRENLDVVKPGEEVVNLLSTASATPPAPPPSPSWWQRLLDW